MILNVTAYTVGTTAPSAQYRIRQHIAHLVAFDVCVKEHCLRWGVRRPTRFGLTPLWMAANIAARLATIPTGNRADLTLVERKMLPAFFPLEQLTVEPRVLDVDDAIWLERGGRRVPALAKIYTSIICGNQYLASWFSQWNNNVHIVPTAVDTECLRPGSAGEATGIQIGWTGTRDNLRYLYQIEPALRVILDRFPSARLLIVCDVAPRFDRLGADRVRFVRWSPQNERLALASMTVGLMPLEDSDWARGKCSFKMLCYMAVGIPVVVSPVGMNAEVLRLGDIGYGAVSCEEWVDTLDHVLRDSELRYRMGSAGRRIAVEKFSVSSVAPQIAKVLWRAVGRDYSLAAYNH
jgi:glycosyltransferase involved in cell wall biosynthesis